MDCLLTINQRAKVTTFKSHFYIFVRVYAFSIAIAVMLPLLSMGNAFLLSLFFLDRRALQSDKVVRRKTECAFHHVMPIKENQWLLFFGIARELAMPKLESKISRCFIANPHNVINF